MVTLAKFLFLASLTSIFLRPFISQLTFSDFDTVLTFCFLIFAFPFVIIRRNNIKLNKVDYFVVAFTLAFFTSLTTSLDLDVSIKKLYVYLSLVSLFYFARSCNDTERKLLLKTVILSSLFVGLYGIYQYFIGIPQALLQMKSGHTLTPARLAIIGLKRIWSTFPSPNAYAGYLIMAIPLSLGMSLNTKNRFGLKQKGFLVLAMLLFINLILTQSIAAILSIIIASGLIAIVNKNRSRNLIICIVIAAIALAAILYLRLLPKNTAASPIQSMQHRISYCREAILILKQHPLMGVGLGNYPGVKSMFAHNSYLQIWIELGLLGIVSFLGIIILTIKSEIKSAERSMNR
ncbi:O-antigen ligase family protein [Thermoproteota archaeon]